MKPSLSWVPLLALWFAMPAASGADTLLIIGDSLSKEYLYELDYIGGEDADGIKNWNEILDQRRSQYFEYGPEGDHVDLRLIGHEYNWSVPGSDADDWWNDYLSAGFPQDELYGIPELEDQLENDAERIVVFLGGNDLRANYGSVYDGSLSTSTFANNLFNDIEDVVNWVLQRRKSGSEVVLVNVPHLGATPSKNDAHPYHPTKTGRVTTALNSVNNRLTTFAQQKNIGLADIYSPTLGLVIADQICIGNMPILRYPPHSDGNPRYCFLGDGLHPNMPLQALFAQIIVDAFNTKYNRSIPRITNQEILVNILGFRADQQFDDWLGGHGIPNAQRGAASDPEKDGVANLIEYALDLDPAKSDAEKLPQAQWSVAGGQTWLTLTWKLRAQLCPAVTITAQQSGNLTAWQNVAAGNLLQNPDGSISARLLRQPGDPPVFLRLKASLVQP
ncbi:MAG: hypothetical protein KA004_11815 [Verrucomicrobiales bacterium]|nr:hypothetical protein [Verrucomicrobiales bacterium]